jgi:hypothetical protein
MISQHFALFDPMMPYLLRCRILSAGIARHLRSQVANMRNDDYSARAAAVKSFGGAAIADAGASCS